MIDKKWILAIELKSGKYRFSETIDFSQHRFNLFEDDYEISSDNFYIRVLDDDEINVDIDLFGALESDSEIVEFHKLPIEIVEELYRYIKDRKEKKIKIGQQWAFIKVGEKYHAFGANIFPKENYNSTLNSFIKSLEKHIKNRNQPKLKLKFITFFLILVLVLLGLYFIYPNKIKELIPNTPMNFNEKSDSMIFLRNEFPIISEWSNSSDIKKKKISDIIFDYNYISNIWQHTHNKNWNNDIPKELLESTRARAILFDFINYNSKVKKICKEKIIKDTNFKNVCDVFLSSYKSKIFYWKTGKIETSQQNKEIYSIFEKYHLPIKEENKEYCFDKRIQQANEESFKSIPITIRWNKDTYDKTNWVLLHIRNINNTTIDEDTFILFKTNSPTKVLKGNADIILNNKLPESHILLQWYKISSEYEKKAHIIDGHDKSYTIENSKFYKKIFKKEFIDSGIVDDVNIIDINDIDIKESKEMLITSKLSSKPQCDEIKSQTYHLNINGEYGAGFSAVDPISTSVMYNILNTSTFKPIAKVEKDSSELHESHLNLSTNVISSSKQIVINGDIKEKILRILENAESFKVTKSGGVEEEFINLSKLTGMPTPDSYMFFIKGRELILSQDIGEEAEITINNNIIIHYDGTAFYLDNNG